jgi:hypothetical protein
MRRAGPVQTLRAGAVDVTGPRPEQIEDAGERRPEACASHVEGRREPRTKSCDGYRPGHRASWKMTPSVYRLPVWTRLTPWRTAAR